MQYINLRHSSYNTCIIYTCCKRTGKQKSVFDTSRHEKYTNFGASNEIDVIYLYINSHHRYSINKKHIMKIFVDTIVIYWGWMDLYKTLFIRFFGYIYPVQNSVKNRTLLTLYARTLPRRIMVFAGEIHLFNVSKWMVIKIKNVFKKTRFGR